MTPGIWKNRRVLVTGHTGFKGGWLALWLASLGARVTGYALHPPTDPSFFEATALSSDIDSRIGDVRDAGALRAAMAAAAPEVVFHLAAQPLVRTAHADPVETFSTNVMGTVHALEAIRAVDTVRAAVIVTSDKVYDNREWAWGYREIDRLGGREPYGASKACAEIAVEAYRRSYFAPGAARNGRAVGIATTRAGNVIGGGDWAADRLVPDAVRAFAAGEVLRIRAQDSVRPWQHVLDPTLGYLMLAARLLTEPDSAAGPWNFGPKETDFRPVGWIADEAARLWGNGARWQPDNSAGPYEARRLTLDSARARGELGWRPRWAVGTAMSHTVRWYKVHAAGGDVRGLSLAQIAAHAG